MASHLARGLRLQAGAGPALSTWGLLSRKSQVCPVLPSRGRWQARASSGTATASPWTIQLIPCLKDNYSYLFFNRETAAGAIVDPSEAAPVVSALKRLGQDLGQPIALRYILNTHHHWDHTGGNAELKNAYDAQVVGPYEDKDRIPGMDIALKDGDKWLFDDLEVHVLHTPGHTSGHCSFYLPQLSAVFTGDTLFSMGCGRLFEGTPAQMWASLSRLAALPPESQVFCGHEYTASNAKFALAVEPGNQALQARVDEVKVLRSQNKPTIPTTLATELATNPFLRPNSPEIKSTMKLEQSALDVEVFASIRKAKDSF